MGLRPGHSAVGSASALGAEGREFESRCPDQFFFLHSCRFSIRADQFFRIRIGGMTPEESLFRAERRYL